MKNFKNPCKSTHKSRNLKEEKRVVKNYSKNSANRNKSFSSKYMIIFV